MLRADVSTPLCEPRVYGPLPRVLQVRREMSGLDHPDRRRRHMGTQTRTDRNCVREDVHILREIQMLQKIM